MSKTITSPVTRFPGAVTLPDWFTFPQLIEWERAVKTASGLKDDPNATEGQYLAAWLPGIGAAVEAWEMNGITAEHFPASPRAASTELLAWLVGEITKLYNDAEIVPNE